MDKQVTISVRGLLVTAVLVLALLAAYLIGAAGKAGTPARAADETAAPTTTKRVLTMTGTGEATAVPDQVTFRLSVSAKRTDLDDALAEASRKMKRALARLAANGVPGDDVQTTGLSMYPEYDYHSYAPPTLTGYRVTETARVLVKQLGKAGKAISAAVASGQNSVRVSGINLQIGDPDAVLAEARDAAVAEATAKAEQYAEATGQTLGDVVDLREVSSARPVPQPAYLRGAMYDAVTLSTGIKALPIRAGEDELKVTVQIVWSFS